jgi:hypothetical protein
MRGLNFGASQAVPLGANRESKIIALAKDYFDAGKEPDWVLKQTCGPNKRMKSEVVRLALNMGKITSKQANELREQHNLIKRGAQK